jgi:hypothetical protein
VGRVAVVGRRVGRVDPVGRAVDGRRVDRAGRVDQVDRVDRVVDGRQAVAGRVDLP